MVSIETVVVVVVLCVCTMVLISESALRISSLVPDNNDFRSWFRLCWYCKLIYSLNTALLRLSNSSLLIRRASCMLSPYNKSLSASILFQQDISSLTTFHVGV